MAKYRVVMAMAAVAPVVWGTTYVVTTELLPAGIPFLVGALRALPVGLVLLAVFRTWPSGCWWWRLAVLGVLNIGLGFAMIFVSAYRLPGGVAATLGAFQPIIAAGISWILLQQKQSKEFFVAALLGIVGVGMLVLKSSAVLDTIGVAAAIGATASIGMGLTLMKRWGRPMPLMAFTAWQLVFGGLVLLFAALVLEPLPQHFTLKNFLGIFYLGAIGTGLAYSVYFRGLDSASPAVISTLNLLSPITAALIGYILLGQSMTWLQLLGMVLVLASVGFIQSRNTQ
ncbi:MAG: EamA family transporter [Acidobacteriota bacterium]|nr:DMT family transporter [Blastocatellia bacterium]MDW8411248.1 EamA family transporter [Acidobacteriota bacterium]